MYQSSIFYNFFNLRNQQKKKSTCFILSYRNFISFPFIFNEVNWMLMNTHENVWVLWLQYNRLYLYIQNFCLILQIHRFIQRPSSDSSTENNNFNSRIWGKKNKTNKQDLSELYKIHVYYNSLHTQFKVQKTPFHSLNIQIISPWYSI